MKYITFLLFTFLSAYTNSQSHDELIDPLIVGDDKNIQDSIEAIIPEAKHLKKSKIELNSINGTELGEWELVKPCSGKLGPFAKSQKFKDYHLTYTAIYKNRSFSGLSHACEVSSPKHIAKNKCKKYSSSTMEFKTCIEKNLKCFMNKVYNLKVLSDLYIDSCGNQVRGFFIRSFYTPGETVLDLVSPGHTLVESNRFSNDVIEYRDGETYMVDSSEFLFITMP